jgi:hypothetical protein
MTLVSDEIDSLNAGRITQAQLIKSWSERRWLYTPRPETAAQVSAVEDQMGGEGSWDEVKQLWLQGKLTDEQYQTISDAVDKSRGRTFSPYTRMFTDIATRKIKP